MIVSAAGPSLRGIDEALVLEVPIPDAGERGDVPHEGRADVHLAVLADGHVLAVAADVILLNADGVPGTSDDLEDDLRVAHRVAVLLAVGCFFRRAVCSSGAFGADWPSSWASLTGPSASTSRNSWKS
jgi:hypothetical protein